MIGTIALKNLRVPCVIGVLAHEREREQTLFVDVEIDRDVAKAAATDDVAYTVDYAALAKALIKLARDRKYRLLETYAEEASTLCIREFGANVVRMEIRKPGAVLEADWPLVKTERRA
jgi:7,8-dihydroneopterin aldolase/epimerase/oxygenase